MARYVDFARQRRQCYHDYGHHALCATMSMCTTVAAEIILGFHQNFSNIEVSLLGLIDKLCVVIFLHVFLVRITS